MPPSSFFNFLVPLWVSDVYLLKEKEMEIIFLLYRTLCKTEWKGFVAFFTTHAKFEALPYKIFSGPMYKKLLKALTTNVWLC